jgi:hypothetical protein
LLADLFDCRSIQDYFFINDAASHAVQFRLESLSYVRFFISFTEPWSVELQIESVAQQRTIAFGVSRLPSERGVFTQLPAGEYKLLFQYTHMRSPEIEKYDRHFGFMWCSIKRTAFHYLLLCFSIFFFNAI